MLDSCVLYECHKRLDVDTLTWCSTAISCIDVFHFAGMNYALFLGTSLSICMILHTNRDNIDSRTLTSQAPLCTL